MRENGMSRKTRQAMLMYLSICSLVLVSFGSLGLNLAQAQFSNTGVGTESVDTVAYGSLTWSQLEEVDKARLENLSKSETTDALFQNTFVHHGVFGETHSGQIMRDWVEIANNLSTTEIEAKEVLNMSA